MTSEEHAVTGNLPDIGFTFLTGDMWPILREWNLFVRWFSQF